MKKIASPFVLLAILLITLACGTSTAVSTPTKKPGGATKVVEATDFPTREVETTRAPAKTSTSEEQPGISTGGTLIDQDTFKTNNGKWDNIYSDEEGSILIEDGALNFMVKKTSYFNLDQFFDRKKCGQCGHES